MVKPTTRKILRSKTPKPVKESEETRTDTPVGFRLNPDELRRVQEHLLRASRAAGVEITLASYAKAALGAYGDDRRKLSEVELAAEAVLAARDVAGVGPASDCVLASKILRILGVSR